jgi:hypothetical protein
VTRTRKSGCGIAAFQDGVSSGIAASLEDAQVEFRQEWKKRKIGLQLKARGK